MFGDYFSSLPAAVAQGIMWGIMAIGVYITYKVLDFSDLEHLAIRLLTRAVLACDAKLHE
mgnify:CR=1 FL=1